jgi:hypothetical protein
MNDPTRPVDPAATGRPLYNEADIGSGEKSPAEIETEEMIRGIPPLPPSGDKPGGQATGDAGQRDS